MFFWFAGLSVVLVWSVFRDTAIDYRLVVLGALLPDAVGLLVGTPAVLHGVVFSAALLVAVMAATRHRRLFRRRLLAVPIGTFAHLLLDAAWARTEVFWWPLFGVDLESGSIPSLTRPAPLLVLLEVAGVVALVWFARRFRLTDPDRRTGFLRTGRVGRDLAGPPPLR